MEGNGRSLAFQLGTLGSSNLGRGFRLALMAAGLALLAGLVPSGDVAASDAVVAEDRFARVVSSSWGKATVGGTYRLAGSSQAFSVDGSVGRITQRRAGTSFSAVLDNARLRDVDVHVSFRVSRLPNRGKLTVALIGRAVDQSSDYRVVANITPSGAVRLRMHKVVNGRRTSVGDSAMVSSLRVRAGTLYRLRFSAIGSGPTTLRAKVWRAGGTQPSGWHIRRSDSTTRLQQAGGVGVRTGASARVTNVPVTFRLDNFLAKRPASGSGGSGGSGTTSGGYLLMPRAELMALPTSGSAWSARKSVADGSLGSANLCDQDNKHNVRTLAVALVYARTGTSSYYTKARNAIMSAIGTEKVGCYNAILSLGRQLGAYVLAADLIKLSGSDDSTFRSWLSRIRTRELGGHGRWKALTATHNDSTNNWGAFAGASRIAASLYLGDTSDVANAARTVRGFLGDRSAYANFRKADSPVLAWACSSDPAKFTPLNASCSRSGVNLDGVIAHDAMRDENGLRWPMGSKGNAYMQETLQALMLQVELLYRNGYSGAWGWSSSALKRAADVVTRNARAGGPGWNQHSVHQHIPWLLNKRYSLSLPTKSAAFGRVFGYTDWLYSR